MILMGITSGICSIYSFIFIYFIDYIFSYQEV